jgi:spore germination protein KB
MSILIAVLIGTFLTLMFTKVAARFPEQGLPEAMESRRTRKIFTIFLPVIASLWFTAGLLTLLGFIDILSRFINPDISKVILMLLFLAVVGFIIQLPTKKVMYLLEIILLVKSL